MRHSTVKIFLYLSTYIYISCHFGCDEIQTHAPLPLCSFLTAVKNEQSGRPRAPRLFQEFQGSLKVDKVEEA